METAAGGMVVFPIVFRCLTRHKRKQNRGQAMQRKFPSIGLLAISVAVLLAAPVSAAERREVAVMGVCNRSVTPDRGAIVLTAEFRNPELQAATRLASDAYDRVRQAIQRLNLPDLELKTSEYNVVQVREWEKGKTVNKGYSARMGMRVTTSAIQRMGEVIAISSREGLQDVGQLTTFLSDAKALSERIECLQQAAENARIKAEKLANALGAKIGHALQITEVIDSQGYRPPVMAMDTMTSALRSGEIAPPPVEAGKQNISVQVNSTFALQ
jgi:uncharacterized protein